MSTPPHSSDSAIHARFRYVSELDGLRGTAMILIMMNHAHLPWGQGGLIAIDIFFVLSGFLITTLLVNEYDRNGGRLSFRNFYIRRVLRLAPALLIFLTAYVALAFAFGTNPMAQLLRSLIALFYASNWVQAFDLYRMGHLGHTWSLSIEEQFYILWPIALYFMLRLVPSRNRIGVILAMLIVATAAYRTFFVAADAPWIRIYTGLDTHADPLLIGCLLGVVMSSSTVRAFIVGQKCSIRAMSAVGLASLIAWVAWCGATGFGSSTAMIRHYHQWRMLVAAWATAFIIANMVVSRGSGLNALFAFGPFVWLGKRSYGCYVWHFPIFNETLARLGNRADLSRIENLLGAALVAAAIALIVTAASYRFVELPALRLKRHFPSG